jgi:hypothetical protein
MQREWRLIAVPQNRALKGAVLKNSLNDPSPAHHKTAENFQ